MNTNSRSDAYAAAGVDITAGYRAVELMKKGVIVRDCTSFKGLDEYWIRISICTLEEDEKFINILKEVIS